MDEKLHEMRRQNQVVLYGLADLPLAGHPAEAELTELADTAKQLLHADYAGLHVITEDVQATLAASDHGHPQPVPRRRSICAVTLPRFEDVDLVEIPDVAADPDLRDLPLTPSDRPTVRFYAAAPLVGREGFTLGTLCVVGSEPRRLTTPERRLLGYLGFAAVHILDGHRRAPRIPGTGGRPL